MSDRPNIVFIMPDQQRTDMIGCYGDPAAKTPTLDKLAAEGTRFDRAFAQAPLCMPARASLLTERYVRDHGVYQNSSEVDPTVPTFTRALADAGYLTAQTGKTHLYRHVPPITKHTKDRANHLRTYGFEDIHETVGKEASLHYDSLYTDFLESRGLLDDYRTYLSTRQKHTLETDPNAKPAAAWNSEPIPLPLDAYQDAWLGRYTADWIRNYRDSRPFFLQVGFPGPHDPWDAPEEALEEFGDPDIPMPGSFKQPEVPDAGPLAIFLKTLMAYCDSDTMTEAAIKKCRRAYYANMMVIDRSIGQIVDALADRDMLDNTWIIYTSDHGEMMGEHRMVKKMVFYEPSVSVPLIVKPPADASVKHSAALVDHIDISATIRDIAGADMAGSHAKSLLPLLDGDTDRHRDVVVSEAYGLGMFRTETEKLVVYEDTRQPLQYFDLENDPLEDTNLVAHASAQDRVQTLLDKFAKPFLEIPPLRPHRSMVERGSMAKATFFLPGQKFARSGSYPPGLSE